MGKKSGPKSPDYKGAAEAEANASMWNTQYQTHANRPNVTTPWGSQTWTYTPGSTTGGTSSSPAFDEAGYNKAMQAWQSGRMDFGNPEAGIVIPGGSNGPAPTKEQFMKPGAPGNTGGDFGSWSMNTTLDPRLQSALDSQFDVTSGLSGLAEGKLGEVASAMGSPADFSGLPQGGAEITPFSFGADGSGGWRQKAQDAVWNLQKPMLDERRSSLESQLSNMGLARGSEAWNREMRGLRDAEDRAALAAISEGRNEATAGLDMAVKGGTFNNMNRNQALQEMLLRRGLPLDELNSMLSGNKVSMPSFPGFANAGVAQTPDYTGAAANQYQSNVDKYNAQMGAANNAASAVGSIISAFMFSDERLKCDIEEAGILPHLGLRVVYYRYRGLPHRYLGVIAQELRRILPSAVLEDASGFLKVDYSKVLA